MARLTDIRDMLVGVVISAAPETLSPYRFAADSVSFPAVLAVPATPFADYQPVMGGGSTARYRVRLVFLTGRFAEDAGQRLLDEWASPDGPIVPALFAADLDAAEILTVNGLDFGTVRIGAAEYLGFSLLIVIEA